MSKWQKILWYSVDVIFISILVILFTGFLVSGNSDTNKLASGNSDTNRGVFFNKGVTNNE